MTQSHKMSFIESITNVSVGYFVACLSQIIIFPLFGVHLPLRDNFLIGGWMTVVSVVRSYTIRRLFNRRSK